MVIMAELFSQGTSCERNFGHGSVPRILLSIIILHVTHTTMELQSGSSKAANLRSGRRMGRYCGFVAIVRLPLLATTLAFRDR
jgi:hypothetical protein